jgi:ankyrin repeat protein
MCSGHDQADTHAAWTGADVESKERHGDTPLHVAAWHGHVNVARLLLDRGMGWYWCDATPAWPSCEGDEH